MILKHIITIKGLPKNIFRFTFNRGASTTPNCVDVSYTEDDKYIQILESVANIGNAKNVLLDMTGVSHDHKELIIHMFYTQLFQFEKYVSQKTATKTVYVYDTSRYDYKMFFKTLNSLLFFHNLTNEPANIMTTTKFAATIKNIFKNVPKVTVEVFDAQKLLKTGLNLIHGVGKASKNPPMMVKIHYKTSPQKKTVAMIGKGVMFDAGGLQIKTGDANSYEMKGDKTGACVAAAVTYLAASQKLDCNVVCLLPLVENIISGDVLHPGDILRCYNGKTVEVLNTDAEGRLIMADALAYAADYNPDVVLDFATLTGWARKIHCDTAAVIYTPNQCLQRLTESIGEKVGERIWTMPRWPEYKKYTISKVADYKNFDYAIRGCPCPGSGFMAAMFLTNFVPKSANNKYVHFDISQRGAYDHIMRCDTALTGFYLLKKLA